MNLLPLSFRFGGFDFTQIKRRGKWAAYRKTKRGATKEIESFEVVKAKVATKTYDDSLQKWVECDPREIMPANEQWGESGFTLTTEDAALAKLASVT